MDKKKELKEKPGKLYFIKKPISEESRDRKMLAMARAIIAGRTVDMTSQEASNMREFSTKLVNDKALCASYGISLEEAQKLANFREVNRHCW